MPNITIAVGGGFYESDSLPFANQRCVNLKPNFPQAVALKNDSLFEVEGTREIAITSRKASDRNRGSWVFGGIPYFINGQNLYRLDRSEGFGGVITYTVVQVGAVTGSGLCSISDNGTQIIIINNEGIGFIYNPSADVRFTTITSAGFYANGMPEQVVFLDGYFIVTTSDKKAIVSAINNGLSWNALDNFTAEADPDGIVAPFVYRNQLYLLGTQTTECFRNIGGAGVPFERLNGFVLTRGCTAPFSVRQLASTVYWVGSGENEQPVILSFNGSDTQKISTTAIDTKIHELSEKQVGEIYSWAYGLRGHKFIAFSSSDWTFIYDVATQRWHERESQVISNNNRITKKSRIQSAIGAYNEILVGDTEDGRIGLIDAELYSEYELPLVSFFTTSPLYELGNSFSLPSVEVLCESGVGNAKKEKPEIRLSVSRDGATFENPRTRLLGSSGQRKTRQVWYKNGRVTRFCIFKVEISDPVRRRIFALELKYKRGSGNA
jgi:hypothetical protein